MPLTLTLQTPSAIPLEVDTIDLETVRSQSTGDVLHTLIQRGNKQVPLGEFFSADGSAADDATIVWQGDLAKVKLIGSKLASGTVRVEGNAGMHMGAEMTGGEILCTGDAADWAGAEMKGGRITIRGNAGHLVGAGYRGSRKGMTGGEILVHGHAGNEVGHTMRRGLIAVGGRCGDAVGVGLIAGTVFVFGEPGIRHGMSMKRGTLAFFNPGPQLDILPTFRKSCTYRPSFLPIFLRHLQEHGFPIPPECFSSRYHRYCGDLLEIGRGELLVREAA
ncbi:MAG: formylmethanofuran dehydrogenase subunit C [Planctomycetaceae bacterium]|nr:formylmethanofuran dehydrogenase subunit C [Planctomycetaceae bacterium]